jgi:hypothetical protein
MNNFCFRVKYKFEIDSELKFQSLICSLFGSKTFDKKVYKNSLMFKFLQYHSNGIYFQHNLFYSVGNLCFKFESQ